MKKELINVLEGICPDNVFLQGSLAPDEPYPDSFITFWTNYTDDHAHFDSEVFSVDWQFSVIYYSNDPAKVGTVPGTIITAMRNAGFIPQGKGFDIASDVPTHTGWAMDFIKTEYL